MAKVIDVKATEVKEAEVKEAPKAETPAEEPKKRWFRRPTKEGVIKGLRTAGKVILGGCEIAATIGGGILGAMVIVAAGKELVGGKKPETVDSTAKVVEPDPEPVTEVFDETEVTEEAVTE